MRVLVLSTNSEDLMIILWCLHEAGHTVFALGNRDDHDDAFYKFFCKKMVFLKQTLSYSELNDGILEDVKRVVKNEKIDVIAASGFESIKFIATYREELERIAAVIPTPGWDLINMLGNKFSFSEFCVENDIPHPSTFLLKDPGDFNSLRSSLKYPLFMKPLDRAAGEGVERIDDVDSLVKRLDAKKKIGFGEFPVLLQESIPGYDIDLNGYCFNGEIRAWTIHRVVRIPLKKEKTLGWHQFSNDPQAFKVAQKVIHCSKYSGPLNLDMRYDERDGKIKTIEVNTRFWATTIFSLCDGVNFPDVGVQLTQNSDFKKNPLCSNRFWGSPHWLPFLLLKNHNQKYWDYACRHSWEQFKFVFFENIPRRLLRKVLRNK